MYFTYGVRGESLGETGASCVLTIQHGLPQPGLGASWPRQPPPPPPGDTQQHSETFFGFLNGMEGCYGI